MITIQNLEMRYGPQVLFSEVSLQLVSGERYGLVGANGAGKSTFLRLLAGSEQATGGEIRKANQARLGFLEQDQSQLDPVRVMDAVIMGKANLLKARKRMEELLEHTDFAEAEAEEYARCEEVIRREKGYEAEAEAAKLLEGLGLPEDRHQKEMRTLSGGYRLRVLLARALFSDPDILLLDEPTNHLDLASIVWLEGWMKKFRGLLVITSHDREFISAVSTRILDADFGTIREWPFNYETYLKAAEEDRLLRESMNEKAEKRVEQLQTFVDRFRAKASKARQAHSKARQIEKLEEEIDGNSIQSSNRRKPVLNFRQHRHSGRIALKIEGLRKSFGTNRVLDGVELEVERGEHIAVLGPNGAGKSTLVKILAGVLAPDSGSANWGHNTRFSYFPQDFHAELTGSFTVLEWLMKRLPKTGQKECRDLLARVLFRGDDVHKRISSLSGGEGARLILAGLMAEESNVLLMDEPTNHLDLESVDELGRALQDYEGTLILVSHNRWLVSRVARRFLEIFPGGSQTHHGEYSSLIKKGGSDHLARDSGLARQRNPKPVVELSDGEKKQKRELANRLNRIEKDISAKEAKNAKLHERMQEPDFYTDSDETGREKTLKESERLDREIEELNRKWEECAEQLEALEA